MLTVWWLAIVGSPVFIQPLPASPGEPAALALASGRLPLRMPCLALRCADMEWSPAPYRALTPAPVPGAWPQLSVSVPARLQSRRYAPLWVGATPRDGLWSQADANRVLTMYRFDAIRQPQTELRLQLGTGYRLQPYADDGTASEGPIARGALALSQRVGERALVTQQVKIETGRENTFLRQSLGVDIVLQPNWWLRSQWQQRRDSAGNGGEARTESEGSVELRYAF